MRTRYTASDFVTLLWRERNLMAIVFVGILAVGIAFALTLKTQYTANSSVSVRLGQEYVYQPRTGDAGRGALPTIDDVVQTEIEIMHSRAVAEQVVHEIGLARIYPKLAHGDPKLALDKAVASIGKNFDTAAAPDTSIVKVSFKHTDKVVAARMLYALLDAYLARRVELLQPNTPAIEAQKQATDARLSDADKAYDDFLTFNNIGDFESERDSLKQAQNTLEQQRLQTAATLKDKESRLARDDVSAGGRRAGAGGVARRQYAEPGGAERACSTSGPSCRPAYLDGSEPMKDIDQKIADMQKSIASHPTGGDSARRMGPNPVYQSLQNDQISTSAEVSGLKSQLASLDDQLKQNTERQLRLAGLQPQYNTLTRDRGVLQDNAKAFEQREQETLAAQSPWRPRAPTISASSPGPSRRPREAV